LSEQVVNVSLQQIKHNLQYLSKVDQLYQSMVTNLFLQITQKEKCQYCVIFLLMFNVSVDLHFY